MKEDINKMVHSIGVKQIDQDIVQQEIQSFNPPVSNGPCRKKTCLPGALTKQVDRD